MNLSKDIINIIVKYIRFNSNIDFECKFLEKHIYKINWNYILENKNISLEYSDKIIWDLIYRSPFLLTNLSNIEKIKNIFDV